MDKDKIIIQCTAGPPCHYLLHGNEWICSFKGLCQYQRPLRYEANNQVLTESITQPEIKFCPECGTALTI